MNRITLILFLTSSGFFFKCKEIPTFQVSENPIRQVNEFEIIKDVTARKAVFFIKYTSQLPYEGFEIQVRNSKGDEDFNFYSIIKKESATNDSLFYVDLEDVPYRYNEFSIQAFLNLDDGKKYSDPLYAELNQHVFSFREFGISNDSTSFQLYWNHNFISNYGIHFFIEGTDGSERVFSDSLIHYQSSGYLSFDLDSVDFEPTTEISYSIFLEDGKQVPNSTERHPFFVEIVDCLEKREGFYFMSLEGVYQSYSFRDDNKIEYGWNDQCVMDEVQIIRDDGGRYRNGNKPWANEIIETKENTNGPISTLLSSNKIRSYTQIWFRAKSDSIYTELTIPFIIGEL